MRPCPDCEGPIEELAGAGRPRLRCRRCSRLAKARASRQYNRRRYWAERAPGRRRRAVTHGTPRMYQDGCRCEVCKAEEAEREIAELIGAT